MSGSGGGSWGRDGARTAASTASVSPWAALDGRRRGPGRLPVLLLVLAAAAILVVGVAVGAGTPVVSHGGLVAIADADEGSGDDQRDDRGGDQGSERGGSDADEGSGSGSAGS